MSDKNTGLEIFILDSLLKEISDMGIKKYPREFGGLLIGHYNDNYTSLTITCTLLPEKFNGSRYLFERSIDGLKESIVKLYNLQPRQYYIGEWHTHPDGSTNYSNTDLNAMIEIENCEAVGINNPILLIVSVSRTKMNDFSFYFYKNKI